MSKRILVVGDIIIDRYIYVESARTSQEAPIPVWDEIRTEDRLGGAANVAANVKAIGGKDVDVFLAGIAGHGGYINGSAPVDLVRAADVNTDFCIGGATMIKRRYVDPDGNYILRSDKLKKFSKDSVDGFNLFFNPMGRKFDVVVFSDYDKGTITDRPIQATKEIKTRIVDSKRDDLSIFAGMNVLKLNEDEYSHQASSKHYVNFERLFDNCVITLGSKGAQRRKCSQVGMKGYTVETQQYPAEKVNAVDVTGCGDTHTAAMAVILAGTSTCTDEQHISAAIKFANSCAGKVVRKFGTSVPTNESMV